MLLLDRILRGESVAPPGWTVASGGQYMHGWQQQKLHLMPMLADAQVVVADNVAEYFHVHSPNKDWSKEDFPTLTPPFPRLWIEWRPTSKNRYTKTGSEELYDQIGVFVEATEIDIATCRWCVRFHVFMSIDKQIHGPLVEEKLVLDKDGRPLRFGWDDQIDGSIALEPLDRPTQMYKTLYADAAIMAQPEYRSALNLATALGHPAMLAISFFHCKNVKLVQEAPPPKLSKAHNKRHGRPLLRYHVLEITPLKAILQAEGNVQADGLPRALHICRGHFKDFRQNGLFGKYKDVYWWDHHMRGKTEEGIVTKDYTMKLDEKA